MKSSPITRWMFDEFGISVRSLAISRILFCGMLLAVMFPRYPWMAGFPSTSYAPPLGFAAIFVAQPAAWALWGIVGSAVVLTLLLLFGWRTRVVGLLLAAVLLIGNSFEYAFGKINHDILLIVTLVVLSFSDWGEALSLDAIRRPALREPVRWPIALLVAITGVCMFGSAISKLAGGWLDVQTHATLGYLLSNYYTVNRHTLLGAWAIDFLPDKAWEALDWVTILIEMSFLPAIFSLRATRTIYLLTMLFHAAVQYTMHIFFWPNLLAYAMVVEWDSLLNGKAARYVTDEFQRLLSVIRLWQIILLGLLLTACMYVAGNLTLALLRPIGLREDDRNSILMTAVLAGTVYYYFKMVFRRHPTSARHPVVLFDGVCGLCNRAVDFVIARDQCRQFTFSPLQSAAGQAQLRRHGLDEDYIDSMVLIVNDNAYTHSAAALHALRLLGWPWRLFYVFILCPPIIRDAVYDFIARNRYRWFGKHETCRLPTPADRERFVLEEHPL